MYTLGKNYRDGLKNTNQVIYLILSQVIIIILHVLGLHKNNSFVFYDDSMNKAVLHAYIYMNINANSSKV